MSFLCPRCHKALAARGGSHATCPGCGLIVDLARADTDAGGGAWPARQDLTGEVLSVYRLEALIGAGGMGTVYRASHVDSHEVVAVKVLFRELAAQPAVVERFAREAKALAELTHANVVRFIDHGDDRGHHYLAMEHVEGQSLEALLGERPMAPSAALGVVIGIAQALEAAHAHGIVHRDLKPANVIVTAAGVKVLDFGIAHVETLELTLTHTDAILGTVNYMAPEQRTRAKSVDGRADIYSLGVIFYRALTGSLPFGTFEPPSAMNPAANRRYDAVIARMLQRDPDKRYSDAGALLEALRALARPRRRALAVLAASAVGAAAAAAATWLLWPSEPPTTPVIAAAPAPVGAPAEAPSEAATTLAPAPQTPAANAPLKSLPSGSPVQQAEPNDAQQLIDAPYRVSEKTKSIEVIEATNAKTQRPRSVSVSTEPAPAAQQQVPTTRSQGRALEPKKKPRPKGGPKRADAL